MPVLLTGSGFPAAFAHTKGRCGVFNMGMFCKAPGGICVVVTEGTGRFLKKTEKLIQKRKKSVIPLVNTCRYLLLITITSMKIKLGEK